MPSFDIVSAVDKHELSNAVDQANREVNARFDFKNTNSEYKLSDDAIQLNSQTDFQIKQMQDILHSKLAKRGIDIKCIQAGEIETSLHEARQKITIKQGIDSVLAKKIIKAIKDNKLKVQTSIQGDQIRITGKKRDDLQQAIALLKEQELELPLQFVNFREA